MKLEIGSIMYLLDSTKQTLHEIQLTKIDPITKVLYFYLIESNTHQLIYLYKLGESVFISKHDAINKAKYRIEAYTPQYIVLEKPLDETNIQLINSCKTINEIVKNRNIKHLYHFTNVKNLLSILELNLLPVNMLNELGVKFEHNDSQRLDGYINRNSLSLSFPNDYYLIKLIYDHPERTYVILEYDIQIINFSVDPIFYCKHNAARGDILPSRCVDVESFNAMFSPEYYPKNPNRPDYNGYFPTLIKRSSSLPLCYPSDSQAEILIKDEINSLYIQRIIFKDYIDPQIEKICNDFHKKCVIDKRYFANRDAVYEEILYG